MSKYVQKSVAFLAVVASVMLFTAPAHAGIDVSGIVTSIEGLDDPINKIGAAILGIAVVIFGWRLVRSFLR